MKDFVQEKKTSISSFAFEVIFKYSQAKTFNYAPHTLFDEFQRKICSMASVGGYVFAFLHFYSYFYSYTCAHGSGDFSVNSDPINSSLFEDEALYNFLSKKIWPSFFTTDGKLLKREEFDKKISKILQLDIRSLYPTAQCLKQPVLNPILFSTCIKEDAVKMADSYVMKKNGIYSINDPCQNVRNSGKNDDLFVVPVNNHCSPYHR